MLLNKISFFAFLILWFSGIFNFSEAQSANNSIYAQILTNQYLKKLSDNYEEDKKRIVDSRYKKTIKSYYKARYVSSKNRILNGHYILDEPLNEELQRIVNRIAASNKNYPFQKTSVFITRYTLENAFSIGDGTICLNIGLLKDLKTEGELAFALCHEFAHYFLDHSNETLIKKIKTVNEADYQSALEDIMNTEYYQISKYKDFMRKNIYEDRLHQRTHEFEADSLGLVLFENAGYAFNEAQSLINLLKGYGEIKENDGLNVFSILKIDSVSYKNASLNISDNNKDTFWDFNRLKTHPDCELRSERLKTNANIQNYEPAAENFKGFVDALTAQFIEELWQQWLVDDLFIETLKRLSADSSSKKANEMAVLVSQQVLQARKDHRINKYFFLPSEYQIKSYIDLSSICYSMRVKQLNEALYQYASSCYIRSVKSERALEAMISIATICEKPAVAASLINQYKKQFPNQKKYK